MLPDFFKALVQAYVAPQASARAILASGASIGSALLLVVLGYLLTMVVLILTPGIEMPKDIGPVDRHLFGLISSAISFFVISTLVFFFGRVSGGTGTREQTYVIVAWHGVVTAILSAPVNLMMAEFDLPDAAASTAEIQVPDGGTIGLAMVAIVIWCWLLAHFITVLHNFKNFWGVAAVVMGIPVALGFLFVNVFGALSTLSTHGLAQ